MKEMHKIRFILLIILCAIVSFATAQDVATPDVEVPTESAACTMQYDPVCSVGGQTYSNECMARVAGAEVSTMGVCPKVSRAECSNAAQPVCGANGMTYAPRFLRPGHAGDEFARFRFG